VCFVIPLYSNASLGRNDAGLHLASLKVLERNSLSMPIFSPLTVLYSGGERQANDMEQICEREQEVGIGKPGMAHFGA
jgi:hypothetical protein